MRAQHLSTIPYHHEIICLLREGTYHSWRTAIDFRARNAQKRFLDRYVHGVRLTGEVLMNIQPMHWNGNYLQEAVLPWPWTTWTSVNCCHCEATCTSVGWASSRLRNLRYAYAPQIDVPAEERQWSHDPNMLLTHPPKQTDSFVLFVKAGVLLSFVKNWNLRFRGRYFAGDARLAPATSPDGDLHSLDPRQTPAFQELDHIASSFRASFPAHLRNPVQDEMVDPYLYSACSAAHLSVHGQHFADVRVTHLRYLLVLRCFCMNHTPVPRPHAVPPRTRLSRLHVPFLNSCTASVRRVMTFASWITCQ